MKLKTIIFCLVIIYIAYSVVILQSTTSTTIVSPTGASTLYSNYYNSLHKDIAGKGVQWITSSKTTRSHSIPKPFLHQLHWQWDYIHHCCHEFLCLPWWSIHRLWKQSFKNLYFFSQILLRQPQFDNLGVHHSRN